MVLTSLQSLAVEIRSVRELKKGNRQNAGGN